MKNFIKIQLVICLLITKGYSQTIDPPESIEIIMQVASNDNTMLPGDTLFKSNTNLIGKAIIVLSDTIGISKIHIKLGGFDGSGNLLNKFFLYNQQGSFNDGTTYFRKGKILTIGLGNFVGINTYYSEVRLEDLSGAFTPLIKYSNVN